MPRHQPHPGGDYTKPVMVKLNDEGLMLLDQLRGSTPRSTYLRDLLMGVHDDRPEPRPEPIKKMKVVPEKKHQHRMERREIVRHQQRGNMQIPIYRYDCGSPTCDRTEERP